MKKYVRNKNFISDDFINKLEKNSNENNNKLILLLLIVNIFIIPNSISKISNELENRKSVYAANMHSNSNATYKNINNDKLILILNSIGNIKKIKIDNTGGFIEVDSMDEVYNIEEKKDFKIKSVEIKEKTISVEVQLWKINTYYILL